MATEKTKIHERTIQMRRTVSQHHPLRPTLRQPTPRPVMFPVREGAERCLGPDDAAETKLPDIIWVAFKRLPLADKPWLWRELARYVYFKIGWSSDYGISVRQAFATEAEARHAASAPGWFYMAVPTVGDLGEGFCQIGTHDFPHSDISHKYRARRTPLTSFTDEEVNGLRESIALANAAITKA